VGRLSVRLVDGVYHLAGEFDMAEVESFVDATVQALDGTDAVTVDLSELTFIDSSGIHAIVRLSQRVGGRGLVLRNPRGTVARVIELIRVADAPGIEVEGRE
jgi:anti-anti-sigma factor